MWIGVEHHIKKGSLVRSLNFFFQFIYAGIIRIR